MTLEWDRHTAKGFGDRHEDGEPGSAMDHFMDKHNNSWGREYGDQLMKQGRRNQQALKSSCKGAVKSGVLYVIIPRRNFRWPR